MHRRFLHRVFGERLTEQLRLDKRYLRRELGPFLVELPPGERLLVIAPHPDDEVIGCGGTLAKAVDAGRQVEVLFLTGGERGHAGGMPDGALVEKRRGEARAAARALGIGPLHFWDLPDGAVTSSREVIDRLRAFLHEHRWDTIFCPSPFERPPDHAAAFELLRQSGPRPTAECWCYEVWSPVLSNYGVDITSSWERKVAALREYPSQLANADFVEKSLGLNAFRSLSYPGVRYAEAFLRLGASDLARWRA